MGMDKALPCSLSFGTTNRVKLLRTLFYRELQHSLEAKGIYQIFGLRNIPHAEAKKVAGLLEAVFYSVLVDKKVGRRLCNTGVLIQ